MIKESRPEYGSRKLLSALPTATADASVVIDHLSALVSWYGAPLVSKSDNGSPLVAEDTVRFWESCGTRMLLSPPYYPRYNGSVECGGKVQVDPTLPRGESEARGRGGQLLTLDTGW